MDEKNKNHIEGGCILLARAITDSDIWLKPPSWLKIWIYILLHVSHKKTKRLERGEGFFRWPSILNSDKKKWTDVNLHTTDNVTRWLKSTGMITIRRTVNGAHITVRHYDLYQNIDTYRNGNENGTVYEKSTGTKREPYIYNNDNNEKNELQENKLTNVNLQKISNFEDLEKKENPEESPIETVVGLVPALPPVPAVPPLEEKESGRRPTGYFIGLFKYINPNYKALFKRKVEHDAIRTLMEHYPSDERLARVIHTYSLMKDIPYCPIVQTPRELVEKLGKIQAFANQRLAEIKTLKAKNKFSFTEV